MGIIASRVQQELQYGPTVIFSIDEEKGTARGSARSVPGFDIHAALKHCEDLLIKWGGHKMAAGMTISLDQMERFSERLENLAKAHPSEVFVSKGRVDLELDLRLISAELVQMLKTLEPHGLGNPIPTFAARKVTAAVQKAFGRDKNHLRVLLDGIVDGVFWRGAQRFQSGQTGNGEALDVVFQLEWDSFCKKPVLNIKDMGRFF